MFDWLWLIPALPLLSVLLIAVPYIGGWNRGERGERYTARVAVWSASMALLCLLVLDVQALFGGSAPGYIRFARWFSSGSLDIELGFMLDTLGLVMATLVAFLSTMTLRFSVNYLHREAGFQRFFMILSLYMAAMLIIMMAGSALLAFVGWELAGVSSYLLIAYAYTRHTSTTNATRVFITNRIGDVGFVTAIVLVFLWSDGLNWQEIIENAPQLDSIYTGLIAASFMLAAMVKSAQVPFAPWIGRALEGPTPSSTIYYGALTIHAGVYLLLRLQPLYEAVPGIMLALIVIGVLTMLYGFFGQLVQTDAKSILIFSTTTQVGLMFFFCGMGWFTLALWYLCAHAIWRVYQFLNAPAMMHLMGRPARPVPALFKRWRWLFIASLQRFWLEGLGDWIFVKPTVSLARDIRYFDRQVVNRMVGLQGTAGSVSSLAQWEEYQLDKTGRVVGDTGDVGRGRGMLGRTMEWFASLLYWFEEHLVLSGGDNRIKNMFQRTGNVLIRIDELLSQPRYLLLWIMLTLVVIL
ncbi:MAG: proton-conducting transporter membrane subunit [Gammaproteobacteria bacterium]|nr:proton-conducting transporter membrane subunit [Gammaproteobacteria bacterium]